MRFFEFLGIVARFRVRVWVPLNPKPCLGHMECLGLRLETLGKP